MPDHDAKLLFARVLDTTTAPPMPTREEVLVSAHRRLNRRRAAWTAGIAGLASLVMIIGIALTTIPAPGDALEQAAAPQHHERGRAVLAALVAALPPGHTIRPAGERSASGKPYTTVEIDPMKAGRTRVAVDLLVFHDGKATRLRLDSHRTPPQPTCQVGPAGSMHTERGADYGRCHEITARNGGVVTVTMYGEGPSLEMVARYTVDGWTVELRQLRPDPVDHPDIPVLGPIFTDQQAAELVTAMVR